LVGPFVVPLEDHRCLTEVLSERRKAKKQMLERLLDIEITEHGTVTEEVELICTMTGYRRRFLVHHLGEGFFRSVELAAS
jgi:hypothetical protein